MGDSRDKWSTVVVGRFRAPRWCTQVVYTSYEVLGVFFGRTSNRRSDDFLFTFYTLRTLRLRGTCHPSVIVIFICTVLKYPQAMRTPMMTVVVVAELVSWKISKHTAMHEIFGGFVCDGFNTVSWRNFFHKGIVHNCERFSLIVL